MIETISDFAAQIAAAIITSKLSKITSSGIIGVPITNIEQPHENTSEKKIASEKTNSPEIYGQKMACFLFTI